MGKESFQPSRPDKLSEKEKGRIANVFEKLKQELPGQFEIEETPDIVKIHRENEKGERVTMGFTKVGDSMLVDGVECPMSEVIEARMRFPKDPVNEAITRLRELKKESKK